MRWALFPLVVVVETLLLGACWILAVTAPSEASKLEAWSMRILPDMCCFSGGPWQSSPGGE